MCEVCNSSVVALLGSKIVSRRHRTYNITRWFGEIVTSWLRGGSDIWTVPGVPSRTSGLSVMKVLENNHFLMRYYTIVGVIRTRRPNLARGELEWLIIDFSLDLQKGHHDSRKLDSISCESCYEFNKCEFSKWQAWNLHPQD